MGIKENLEIINEKIEKSAAKSGRTSSDITLLGVSKQVKAYRIKEAVDSGIAEYL